MVDFWDSEEIQELLASYVLGDLTPEEVASVHQLLDSHPELKAEVSSLQKTLALFPLALPEAELPPTLGSRILQTASGAVVSSIASRSNRIGRRLTAWRGVIGSVAASVVLGLGFYSYRLHQQVVATQAELSHYQETISPYCVSRAIACYQSKERKQLLPLLEVWWLFPSPRRSFWLSRI